MFLPIENYIDEDLTAEELQLLEECNERSPDLERKLYKPQWTECEFTFIVNSTCSLQSS